MNKKYTILSSLSCLILATNVFCGCALVKDSPKGIKSNLLASLLREFSRKGPLTQLRDWEYDIMEPALALEQALNKEHAKLRNSGLSMQLACQKQEQAFIKALKEIKAGQEVLKEQEPVKGTDAYLYFSKNYLAKFEANLMAKMELAKGKADDLKKLESKVWQTNNEVYEAKLAFDNAKAKAFTGQGTYRLSEIKESDISLYSTYGEIRKQLAMPGVFFNRIRVQDIKDRDRITLHQPVLWSEGDRFLYVDFVDGRATFVKLYTAPVVPTTTDKKLQKQVGEWEKNLMEPAIAVYNQCMKAKSEQSKAKIYNERAAEKIEPLLAANLVKLQEYATQVKVLPEDNPDGAFYIKQAKLYVANMVKRVELFKLLPILDQQRNQAYKERAEARKNGSVESKKRAEAQWDKAHKALREAITKGNSLEGRLVPESRLVYLDAKRMLQDGDKNYSFQVELEARLAKNPWQMSVNYWLNMPGQLMQSWTVVDPKNPKKIHNKQVYVWALGDEYLIGEFLDSRLQSYKLHRLNKGFWYGR